jgi:pyridoxamine 5'-phosphate oxidase
VDQTDVDPDPFRQVAAWFEDARAAGIGLPEAAALATATPVGAPSVRMVLLKAFGPDGPIFYSGYESRKARELDANPRAAVVVYWHELGRQVRAEGRVERLPRAGSEAYFATRPRGSRISAWASRQSEPVGSRAALESAAADAAARFEGAAVPLPEHWGGYRLHAERIELWQHRDDRLHDRLLYEPAPEGGWTLTRLQP